MHAAYGHGSQRPGVELPLGTNVEQPCAEGYGRCEPRQDQRRGAGEGFGQCEYRAKGALQQQGISLDHGRPGPQHQQAADKEGEYHGAHWGQHVGGGGGVVAFF
ncbi:hypothetical protein D3C72_1585600 [compost metagenome]